jgi:hypothetical protein
MFHEHERVSRTYFTNVLHERVSRTCFKNVSRTFNVFCFTHYSSLSSFSFSSFHFWLLPAWRHPAKEHRFLFGRTWRAGGQAGRRAGGQAGRRAGGQAGRRAGGDGRIEM